MKPYIWLLVLIFLGACNPPQSRSPLKKQKAPKEQVSIDRNKELLEKESQLIQQYIKKHSNTVFRTSPSGLWYAASSIKTKNYAKGTKIQFEYAVFDIDDIQIYSREQIGIQTYFVDEQPIMFGLKEALSILPKKTSGIFLLPSVLAYGVLGDQNKIKPNTPLVIHLKISNIENPNL